MFYLQTLALKINIRGLLSCDIHEIGDEDVSIESKRRGCGGMPSVYGAVGGGRSEFLPVYLRIPDMPFLLAQNPYRRERPVSRVSKGLF